MVGLSDEGGGGGELNPYLRIKQINGNVGLGLKPKH